MLLLALVLASLGVANQSRVAGAVTQGKETSYLTSAIADMALRYAPGGDRGFARPGHDVNWGGNACIDSNGPDSNGQCKSFLNCVLKMVRGSADPNYSVGIVVGRDEAVKGDIIQIYPTAQNPHLHTAIVLENHGGGNFWVVDSNWDNIGDAGHVSLHNLNPYTSSYFSGNPVVIYRYGRVDMAVSTGSAIITRVGANLYEVTTTGGWTLLSASASAGNWKLSGDRLANMDANGLWIRDGSGSWTKVSNPVDEFQIW